jgi:hypothetical protein
MWKCKADNQLSEEVGLSHFFRLVHLSLFLLFMNIIQFYA